MVAAIDPEKIPGAGIDPDQIVASAGNIRNTGSAVRDHGAKVVSRWQGLSGVYEAPEAEKLFGLMTPVGAGTTLVGDGLQAVAAALTQYAEDVRPVLKELDALRAKAQKFVSTTVKHGVSYTMPLSMTGGGSYQFGGATGRSSSATQQYQTLHYRWDEDQASVDLNNKLISQVDDQQVKLWDAERKCANTIRALFGEAPVRAASATNPDGYGLKSIPADMKMPWGGAVDRTESCGESAVTFVFKDVLWDGIAVGGVWGTIKGLGTLVLGFDQNTGQFFQGSAYGAAWGGLGMIVLTLSPAGIGGSFLPGPVGDFFRSGQATTLDAGKALLSWDEWSTDPGKALGQSIFNVGTIFIPAGAAVDAAKVGADTASILGKAAKVAEFVDPGAWAAKAGEAAFHFVGPSLADAVKGLKGLDSFDAGGGVDTAIKGLPDIPDHGWQDGSLPAPHDTITTPNGIPHLPDRPLDSSHGADVNEPVPVGSGHDAAGADGAGHDTSGAGHDTSTHGTSTNNETGGGHDASDAGSNGHDTIDPSDTVDATTPSGDGITTDHGGLSPEQQAAHDAAEAARKDPNTGNQPDGSWVGKNGQQLDPLDNAAVQQYAADAVTAEQHIRPDLVNLVEHVSPESHFVGLDDAVKFPDSLKGKVSTLMMPGSDVNVTTALSEINDSVRYTVETPADSYSDTVAHTVERMEAQGYDMVKFSNTWGDPGYKGINTSWIDPATGKTFELQFHTPDSFEVKTTGHALYEEMRLPGVSEDVLDKLRAENIQIFKNLDVPPGATGLDFPVGG